MHTQHGDSGLLTRRLRRWAFAALGLGLILNGFRLLTAQPRPIFDDLHVDADVVDLGRIPQGTSAVFRCQLRNPSPHQITSLAVVSSCGCTVIEQLERTLQPGGDTEFTGAFSTIHQRGKSTVNLLIEYEIRQEKRQKVVTVTGDVQPVVSWQPPTVSLQSDAPQIVSFTTTNNELLRIEKIQCSHPALKVVEVDIQGAAAAISVAVDYQQAASVSWNSRPPVMISVKTNVDSEPELRIPVTVRTHQPSSLTLKKH